jgi:hypothetical protein
MNLTLTDMRDALKGQRKATEAIFWFGLFWNSGPDSDLYRAMCETGFEPQLYTQKQIENDPEIIYCHAVLKEKYEEAFGPLHEYPLRRIPFLAVKENDVLICGPGRQFPCIEADWPCRVHLHHGDLGVPCAEDHMTRSFHPLANRDGYVIGFRR